MIKTKNIFIDFLLVIFLILPFFVNASCLYYSPNEAYTPPTSSGTTYYVDGTNGSDSYDGLYVDHSLGANHGPWKTINNNGRPQDWPIKAGDRLLIRAGIYHANIGIPYQWSGTDENHRTIVAAYGDGPVIVDGSIAKNLGEWSQYSSSIYQSTFQNVPQGVQSIVIDDNFRTYHPKSSLANVQNDGDWFYDEVNHKIYIKTPAGMGNPASHDLVIVEDQGDSSSNYGLIMNGGVNWITISGLTIRGFPSHGIWANTDQTHIKIINNKIEFNEKGAIVLSGGNTGSEVIKNYIYGNIMRNWPRGNWNALCSNINAGGWPPSIALNVSSGTAPGIIAQGNIVAWNGGEGIIGGGNGPTNNEIIQDNIVHDNWSVGIYSATAQNVTIKNNFVYSTGSHLDDLRTDCQNQADYNRIARDLRQDGIVLADEIPCQSGVCNSGTQIFNNIILNCRKGISNQPHANDSPSGTIDSNIYNNTIIEPGDNPSTYEDIFAGIFLNYGIDSNSFIKNNLVLTQTPNSQTAYWEYFNLDPTSNGITWDKNLYWNTSGSITPFVYKASSYNFVNWKNVTSQDANSLYVNPLMARTDWTVNFTPPSNPTGTCRSVYDETGVDINDFTLQPDSPAKDLGANLFSVPDDFLKNLRPADSGYDIGALEYGALPPAETIPPVVSGGLPRGVLTFGTTNATVSVSTDENAICKYSLQSDQQFSNMTEFITTGSQLHSFSINVFNGNSYTYYVKCKDVFNNINSTDYIVNFIVASSNDLTPPALSFLTPMGNLTAGTTSTTLSLITDEKATCKYSTNPNVAYSSMTNSLITTNNFSHQANITALTSGLTYTYYIRCEDLNGNANTTDTQINFTVNSQTTSYQQSFYWSGSTNVPDQSLNGTTITSSETPIYITGHDGSANGARNLAIDNNYITFSKTADFNWQQGKMSFWFYPTTIYSNDIFTFQWANGKKLFMNSSSNGRFSIAYDFNSGGVDRFSDSVSVNNWHYIEIAWDLPNNLYDVKIDNIELELYSDNPSWSVTPSNELLYFGRGATYTTYNRAYIDELYFYNPITDSAGPIISNVSSVNADSSNVIVNWTTNENTTSQIEYGTTNSYGLTTVMDDSLLISHNQKIVGLSSGTTYHYRIKSIDASGNVSYSNDGTFTTVASYSFAQFLTMLSNWFNFSSGNSSDFNSDNIVNTKDLGIMMSKWN